VRESDLALRLMIQIRNKLLDAYQEIQNLRM
jgi:flagellar hook-basal body complex protein FliE